MYQCVTTRGINTFLVVFFGLSLLITFDRRVPFVRMLLVVAVLGLIALDPPLAIWGMSVIYGLSGPLQYLRRPDHSRQEGAKDYDKADLH